MPFSFPCIFHLAVCLSPYLFFSLLFYLSLFFHRYIAVYTWPPSRTPSRQLDLHGTPISSVVLYLLTFAVRSSARLAFSYLLSAVCLPGVFSIDYKTTIDLPDCARDRGRCASESTETRQQLDRMVDREEEGKREKETERMHTGMSMEKMKR